MSRRAIGALAALVVGAVGLLIALPRLLRRLGLDPHYDGDDFSLAGKRALIITTSHGVLNRPGKSGGRPTGVWASEMTVPYYEFLDAGMQVDLASIEGGPIPIDPNSLRYPLKTPSDEAYLDDRDFRAKVADSMRIDDVDVSHYNTVFLAGGWGAAYDLGFSAALAAKVSEAYYAPSAPPIGAVCHGALGLIRAEDREGNLLIADRRMTGVTNKQIRELGIRVTPQHPETELREAGAAYERETALQDVFANHVAVDEEGRFITGQNQNAAHEVSQRIMATLEER